ncbi:hypothetical protein JCM24511_10218 [Saitozyma sp. JCM 24511]|nr:hypothetical protein JCM24511_10218 [Saitozyma sp. JCM 24511]
MSALVSATILWLSFTLLELVDVVEDADQGTPLEFLDVEEGEIPHERKSIPVVAKFKAQARPVIGGCQDLCIFFCRTEVELGIGLTLLTEWSVYWKQALYAVFCPIPVSARDQVLLKGSYAVILLGLSALSLQLLVSLALHLLSNGYSSLREEVWGARTGQWACRGMIKLDDEQAGWVKELEEA